MDARSRKVLWIVLAVIVVAALALFIFMGSVTAYSG